MCSRGITEDAAILCNADEGVNEWMKLAPN